MEYYTRQELNKIINDLEIEQLFNNIDCMLAELEELQQENREKFLQNI